MGRSQRQKGKRGERAAVHVLRDLGFPLAARTAQNSGRGHIADVDGIPGLHIEVKVGKAPPIRPAMAQATRDCAEGSVPVVMSKVDGGEWLFTLKAEHLWAVMTRAKAAI